MTDTLTVVADYPANTVYSFAGFDLPLNNVKYDGAVRTCETVLTIRNFPGDKYEYIRHFTVGFDEEGGYWAFGNGSMITSESRAKTMSMGYELGDEISIEGNKFIIEAAPNHNIKFTPV
jgi:hypothetical protein